MEMTNVGLQMYLIMLPVGNYYLGVLNCKLQVDSTLYLALYLERSDKEAQIDDAFDIVDGPLLGDEHSWRLYVVDISQLLPYGRTKLRALLPNQDIRVDWELTMEQFPLWIQMDSDCLLEIIDAFPESQWNFASGTMTPGRTEGLGSGFCGRQNFTAVVLRDRQSPHQRKTLCLAFASNNGDISVNWTGFVEDRDAERACSRLMAEVEECLRANCSLPEGTKLWTLGHRTIKIEERDPLGLYRVFGLSLEQGARTSLQPSNVPLLVQFIVRDTTHAQQSEASQAE